MIDFEWRTTLTAADEPELREMLAVSAAVDQEAGFPQLSLKDPVSADTLHLLVWLLADDRADSEVEFVPHLAAYLRVEPQEGGLGEASYVVRPDYRSRGITTLLLEKIGLDANGSDGWQGSGVSQLRVWARGDHPAAQRITARFKDAAISVARREWRLLMPLRAQRPIGDGRQVGPAVRAADGADERGAASRLWTGRNAPPSSAELLVTGDDGRPAGAVWVDVNASEHTEYGTAGRIYGPTVSAGPQQQGQVRELLVAALERLRDEGLRVASIVVDSEDWTLVHEARLLGFMHDRTDVQYTVGA